jgi:hypothetical protein
MGKVCHTRLLPRRASQPAAPPYLAGDPLFVSYSIEREYSCRREVRASFKGARAGPTAVMLCGGERGQRCAIYGSCARSGAGTHASKVCGLGSS